MRVHEFAKQLSTETGKMITSSQLLVILSKKKEGMKASSTIDEDLMAYARAKYIKPVEKKPEPNKHQKPAEHRPNAGARPAGFRSLFAVYDSPSSIGLVHRACSSSMSLWLISVG